MFTSAAPLRPNERCTNKISCEPVRTLTIAVRQPMTHRRMPASERDKHRVAHAERARDLRAAEKARQRDAEPGEDHRDAPAAHGSTLRHRRVGVISRSSIRWRH